MSRMPEIITIDGPAGVGKSTLAARTAQALGVACLDTGAMFRTVGLALSARGLTPESDLDAVSDWKEILGGLSFSLQGTGEDSRLLCNGLPVGDEVRSEAAGMMASHAARIPAVRAFLKAAQQKLGERFSLVAEGRDMGSVVFPGALCKVFLDATPEIRAQRRCAQLKAQGIEEDFAELAERIRQRDALDRNRAVAPLKAAFDARLIDTSDKDVDAVFAAIIATVEEARKGLPPEVPMRRKDRAWPLEETLQLLDRAEYGVLALDEGSGWPYAVQLSYARLDGVIYFHSADVGRKIRILEHNPRVCLSVTGGVQAVYEKDFSTWFQSAMVIGEARLVLDDEERYRALWELAEKYLPDHMDKADGDIRHSFKRTAVYRIAPRIISGKAKQRRASPKS